MLGIEPSTYLHAEHVFGPVVGFGNFKNQFSSKELVQMPESLGRGRVGWLSKDKTLSSSLPPLLQMKHLEYD